MANNPLGRPPLQPGDRTIVVNMSVFGYQVARLEVMAKEARCSRAALMRGLIDQAWAKRGGDDVPPAEEEAPEFPEHRIVEEQDEFGSGAICPRQSAKGKRERLALERWAAMHNRVICDVCHYPLPKGWGNPDTSE